MALVLKRRIPRIRRSPKRSKAVKSVAKRLEHAWEAPEDYEPQL
ncbi:MAG: hypothetical protein ABC588_00675 [Candidatus Methanosuratincola petrocarbonis]